MQHSDNRADLNKILKESCIVFHPGGREKSEDETAHWTFDFKNTLLNGTTLDKISTVFWDVLSQEEPFQAGGLETTAIGLVAGIVMKAQQHNVPINGFYIRKSRKKTDLQKIVEGTLTEQPVILFDDILNSGKSMVRQIETLELLGKKVRMICTVVRFRENSYYQYLEERGIRIFSIFSLDDFPSTGGVARFSSEAIKRAPARLEIPFSIEWSFAARNPEYSLVLPKSGPALDGERVYFGSDSGTMWALNQNDGSVAWSYSTLFGTGKKRIFSSPAVYGGTVYFGAYDGNFYALDSTTGKKKWMYMEADWVGSSPTPAPDLGLVFIGLEFGLWGKQGGLVALDMKTGKKKWMQSIPTLVHSTPAYSKKQRVVVVGSSGGIISAFNAKTGKPLWTHSCGGAVRASFAFEEERGLVCFGSEDRYVYILKAKTGELVHKIESYEGFYSTPLIENGKLYIGGLDKRVLCIDLQTGIVEWSYWTNGRIFASPLLIEGYVYIGSNDGRLYKLDATKGTEAGFFQFAERIVNKIAYNPATKRLFVPTHANQMFCLTEKISQPKTTA